MMERKNLMARNIGGEIHGQREILRPRTATAPQAFTRQREVGFVGVLSIILNMVRTTPQMEWDDFWERIHPEGETMIYNSRSRKLIRICDPKRLRSSIMCSFSAIMPGAVPQFSLRGGGQLIRTRHVPL